MGGLPPGMCGIAGFVGRGNQQILAKMVEAIKYRGPDDRGFLIKNDVALGHARLSIIDLTSAGHQPMANQRETVWLIFNGEIYNFKELREELTRTGKYNFRSQTDTEVLIYLYEEFGSSFLEKINGMFALALYDFNAKKLLLARDRLGKKPLYWGRFNDAFVFGSELKALLAHPAVKKELDPLSLQKYLFFEYVPTPRSIFKGIHKLESGHFLSFDGQSVEIKKFWDQKFDLYPKLSQAEYLKEMDKRIDEAVKIRLMSDVPLGVFLSGGIDSAAISYYAQKNSAQKIKTFSIGFDDPSFDESAYAERTAKFLGTEHYLTKFSPRELLDVLPRVTESLDEPFADGSLFPTYLLARWARQRVTVALGGDGGDELFAGYPTFQAYKIAKVFDLFPAAARSALKNIVSFLPTSYNNISFDFKLKKFLSAANGEVCHRNQIWLGSFAPDIQKEILLRPSPGNLWEDLEGYLQNVKDEPSANQLLYLYQKQYMRDDILVKVDRASMMNSLEVRAPFLDYTLVDFINSMPYNMKLNGWTTKYIFKRLMADKLPKEIVNRAKKGFGMPIGKWLRGGLKPLVQDYLSEARIKRGGIFDYRFIKKLLDEHWGDRQDNRQYLWTLLSFEMWRKKWL